MNAQQISDERNDWIEKIWLNHLPKACDRAGHIPDWATRSPLWTHPDDFDIERPVVVCGINPGYRPKHQDPYCKLPMGLSRGPRRADIRAHNRLTKTTTQRYFGPYLRMIGDQTRFYDLLPMRESSMSKVRDDYRKGFEGFINRLVITHMEWLRLSSPKIVWMNNAWAMELIGCKDSMKTTDFPNKHFISDPVNCFLWESRLHFNKLLLFKGDSLCGTRSASVPTRNRLLRDWKKCLDDLEIT